MEIQKFTNSTSSDGKNCSYRFKEAEQFYDSSTLAHFSSDPSWENINGFAVTRVLQEANDHTPFKVPNRITEFSFILPLLDNKVVTYSTPFPIEWAWRTDGTTKIERGEVFSTTPPKEFQKSSTTVGFAEKTAIGTVVVKTIQDWGSHDEFNKFVKTWSRNSPLGFILKKRNGDVYNLRIKPQLSYQMLMDL